MTLAGRELIPHDMNTGYRGKVEDVHTFENHLRQDYPSISQGNRQNYQAERKLLDQKPRDARLQSRKGSPLGLTLEELDDRGLLDGGGVVPSYYTSLKQRNRRHLEMRNRSSRLAHRGLEDETKFKNFNRMMKMIRVLVRKGLNLDECFRHLDFDGRGLVDREQFLVVLRGLGLPFSPKDSLSLSDRYSTSNLQVDYESFINDAMSDIGASVDGDESVVNSKGSPHFRAIVDLRSMLIDSKNRLHKTDDDVYRMFSKWDSSGRGLVTMTQFFRVLAQLHVVLTDRDQDVIADILDVDGNGKVDFDSFLLYCSVDDESALGGGGVTDGTDETIVSGGGSTGNGSGGHNNTSRIRPHTAAAFRGAGSSQPSPAGGLDRIYTGYTGGDEGDSYVSHDPHLDRQDASPTKSVQQRRPLTASGRVLHVEYRARERDNSDKMEHVHVRRPSNSDNLFILDIQSDEEQEQDDLPLANDAGSHTHTLELVSPESGTWDRFASTASSQQQHISHNPAASLPTSEQRYISSSRRDEHQPVYRQQQEQQIPDHQRQQLPRSGGSRSADQVQQSREADRLSREYTQEKYREAPPVYRPQDHRYDRHHSPVHEEYRGSYAGYGDEAPQRASSGTMYISSYNQQRSGQSSAYGQLQQRAHPVPTVPVDNAPVTVVSPDALESARAALHQTILAYHARHGSTLREIFALIDTSGIRYFNAKDLMVAANNHFCLAFGPLTTSNLVKLMALDGSERVSFSEFVVFVNDPHYKVLEEKVQTQVAGQLEQQGREYQYLLFSVLSHESTHEAHDEEGAAAPVSGLVASASFGASLLKLGLQLDPSEINRIITRFDTHGTGQCSVSKFMNMIQSSDKWKQALEALAYHEEAIEECQVVRQRMLSNARHVIKNTFDEETLEMAEYLGIRILSEPHLLWIVDKAIHAPLPAGWSVHTDKDGRTFFFNAELGITRWDHPLDPHFRQLRDEARHKQNEIDKQQQHGVVGTSFSLPRHHPTGSVPDMSAPTLSYRRDAEPPPVEKKPVPAPTAPPPPRHEYRETASLSVDAEEEESTSQEATRLPDDDEMSDYYHLRRKPVPRESKRQQAARPSSANESQLQQQGSKSKDKNKSSGGAKSSSRPVSAPFDRVENEHTYRTKNQVGGSSSNTSTGKVAPARTSSPARQKSQLKQKPQPVHNILLPGGIYTTGLASAHKMSSKRVQPSSSAPSLSQHQVRPSASYGKREDSPQRPPTSGGYSYNHHGHKEKVRPSSSSAPRPLSATGRTLSHSEQQRLNQMYQADMIDQLDDAILSRDAMVTGQVRRDSESIRHNESNPTASDRHYPSSRGGGSDGNYGTVPLGQQQRDYVDQLVSAPPMQLMEMLARQDNGPHNQHQFPSRHQQHQQHYLRNDEESNGGAGGNTQWL